MDTHRHQVDHGELSNITVHTGFPNPATDLSIRSLDFNKLLIKHPVSTFLMRIEGNEWEDRGIFDSDIIIIDKSLKPNRSDLVVWWQESNFVISHYNKIPIDFQVWGIVTSIIHRQRQ